MSKNLPPESAGTIVVVGGGPAGAFFSLRYLKEAARLGRKTNLIVIEKRLDPPLSEITARLSCREGCNYCAGGISPKLAAALRAEGLDLPKETIAGEIRSLTVHGHWKNIELRVPEHKRMYAVFRGSRPKGRENKHKNFDSFLLEKAREAGARVVSGEVYGAEYSAEKKPIVFYRFIRSSQIIREAIEADCVVFAGGVNQTPAKPFEQNPIFQTIAGLIPGFRPPKVRKALISELELKESDSGFLEGEVYFVEYGSRDLKIEMSSLIPKGKYVTVVLLGKSIDRSEPSHQMDLLRKYLELPQIMRILPRSVEKYSACLCQPFMTVGSAKHPIGHRAAVIGDLAVSRLYKDGIYSAYLQAAALANTILNSGPSKRSLDRGYRPAIQKFERDNTYGRIVFMINRVVFSNPMLSRILYQAVLTERKTQPQPFRRLEDALWKIASGDDTYRASLISMFRPRTIFSILVGGLLITVRNYLTERIFGLKWGDLGRYPTGLHKEDMEEKRKEFIRVTGAQLLPENSQFESMYSIKIKSDREKIFKSLGTFGDRDRRYFRPRLIRVQRISGGPNEPGCLIEYKTPFRTLDFRIILKKKIEDQYLIYQVKDGFARGGILVFAIDEIKPGVFWLYIFVAFNFARGERREKIIWRLFRHLFPGFIHDVLWNHSLCKLKDTIEGDPLEESQG